MRSALFWGITQRRMVTLYHPTLRNNPEVRRSHRRRSGSLKTRTVIDLNLARGGTCLNKFRVIVSYRYLCVVIFILN
jgi:hypothetical protein